MKEAVVAFGLLISGCLAHRGTSPASGRDSPEAWLVLMRGVPLARVTLASGSMGNVVNVEVESGAAEVTLGHKGPVKLESVPGSPGLRVTLHQFNIRALAIEQYGEVERAVREASWASRDNLAEAVLRATSDEDLVRALGRVDGRWALVRLYDEVTSGHVSDEERAQAQRVLRAWAQHIGIEGFGRAIEDERTRVFPVRKSGPTVRSPVSPTVQAGPDGLGVSLSSKVYEYPESQSLGGMRLRVPYDEVVGVKLYDAGGAVRYVPALFLVEVSNAEGRRALQKCGEMFALGLTFGLGGGAAGVIMWCDRVAVGIGLALSVVDDHRGWILERYGVQGVRFLRAADVLSSLVAFYGLGRVAVAVPRAVHGLRQTYLEMKASQAALSADERALLGRIGHGVDELLEQAEKASKGGEVIPIERARKPNLPPAAEEQPLRATGTDVQLVPLGPQPAGPKTVATRRFHPEQLADHFERHGADFGARTAAEYEQMAERFLTGQRGSGVLERVRLNGDIVRFDPTTDAPSTSPTPPCMVGPPTWTTSMPSSGMNTCPVCGFAGLDEPAYDANGCASFGICPCCGIQFGYDDATRSHAELRAAWVQRGMPWWSRSRAPPPDWDPAIQVSALETP